MSLIVGCAQCGKKYKVGEDKAGKKIKCQCGGVIAVPRAAAGGDPWDDPAAMPPAPSSRSELPPTVLGRKSLATPAARKKGKSSGGAPVGMILGIASAVIVLLGGAGVGAWLLFFRDKPAATPNVAQNSPTDQPTGNSSGGQQPLASTPSAAAASDFRKFIPEDAQVAVIFQPQKVLQAKLITSLIPEKVRTDFLNDAKKNLPIAPESVAKMAVYFSPPPADFPADEIENDPSSFFTAVIQFNDSRKMSDRLSKVLAMAPLKPMSGLPGQAWSTTRDEMDDIRGEEKKQRYEMKDGKRVYVEKSEDGPPGKRPSGEKGEPKDFGGKRVAPKVSYPEHLDLCLYAPDDQTLIAGLKVRIRAIAKGTPSPLHDLLKDVDLAHELVIAGTKLDDFKPPKRLLQGIPGGQAAAMPLMMVSGPTSKIRQMLLQVGISPGANLIDVRLTAKDETIAQEFEKQITQGKDTGKQMSQQLAGGPNAPANTPAAQVFNEIEKNWKVSRTGAELRFSVAHTPKLNELAIVALEPAVNAAKVAATRTEDRNNLKQIGLGIYNFESSFGQFPPAAGFGDKRDGLPVPKQVGWLADLLPYIEYQTVYNGIHRENAWDDPSNKASGSTIVSAYVNSETPAEMVGGYAPAHIVGIGGLGANGPNEAIGTKTAGVFAFHRKTNLRSMRDGSSNTMMAAQAYKDFGPWIANTNATIRPFTQKPYLHGPDGIGGPGKSGATQVLMGDGSVKTLSDDTDPAIIEAMATMSGGEPVGAGAPGNRK